MAALALALTAVTVVTAEVLHDPRPPAPVSRCPGLVAAMPPRDRLAQRLMVGVDASDPAEAVGVVAGDHVGGIFLGGNATALLRGDALTRVQAATGTPVAVAVDDEGGRVQRLDDLIGSLPSARELAATKDVDQVRALAAERGRAMRARGVTVDLAPVLDVSAAAKNTVIGDRSFSADPDRVAEYAGAFAAGLRDAGVLPVFKHFPGHGRGVGDSHKGRVTTPPLAALREVDLRPYRTLLADRSAPAAVMLGHLDVPGLTGADPATLSPAGYRLLRDELGFTGLVLTDDLGAMRAISNRYELPDAVLTSLKAGADMALMTTNPSSTRIAQIVDRLEAAAAAGELPDSDNAVARILAAKGVC